MAALKRDAYSDVPVGLGSPAVGAFAITPGADRLEKVTRGISFAAAGEFEIEMVGLEGSTVTVTIPSGALSPGQIHALRCVRVLSTSGDMGMVGYY